MAIFNTLISFRQFSFSYFEEKVNQWDRSQNVQEFIAYPFVLTQVFYIVKCYK